MGKTPKARPVWPVMLLALIVVGAAGVVAGSWLVPVQRPESLAPAPTSQSVTVQRETFDDARQVAFKPVRGAEKELASPREGLVTSTNCKPGSTIASGHTVLTLDSEPVIALWTEYPLYRDIASGDKGSDVTGVKAELRRLGYYPSATDKWDAATSAAWKRFLADRDVTQPPAELSLATILPLPRTKLQVAACNAPVRSTVAAGQALVTSGGELRALKLAATDLKGLVPGKRAIALGEASAAVGKDGKVTDATFLAKVAASDEYAVWLANKDGEPIQFDYRLAKPVGATVVPASALYNVSAEGGCLLVEGKGVPVEVLTSKLGSTYVATDREITRVGLPGDRDRAGNGPCT